MSNATRDGIRRFVVAGLESSGWTATDLARAIGVAPSTINRFLNDRRAKHILSLKTLKAISAAVNTPLPPDIVGVPAPRHGPPPLVAPGMMPPQPYRRRHANAPPALPATLAQQPAPPRDLPILGQAKGGLGNALFLDQGRALGYVDRPSYLVNVPGAFAVIVRGDSMEPRYAEGELVFVHPHKPPRPGGYVVIETVADEAFLKRLVRIGPAMVVTRALNPPPGDQMEFPLKAVRRIHRVVGMTEDWA